MIVLRRESVVVCGRGDNQPNGFSRTIGLASAIHGRYRGGDEDSVSTEDREQMSVASLSSPPVLEPDEVLESGMGGSRRSRG